MDLDIYDREILRYLLKRFPVSITTNQIAQDLELSWNTVRTHLAKLKKKSLVKKSGVLIDSDLNIKKEKVFSFWKVNR